MVIWLAKHINAMDRPGVRTVHSRPIARIGGLAIYTAVAIPMVAIQFLEGPTRQAFWSMSRQLSMLAVTATIVFAIGLIDDLRGLPARIKLAVESISAIALYVSGVSISSIHINGCIEIHLGSFGMILTWLWIVGITNAVNLSDGLDGLAAGISAITCAVISVFSIYQENLVMAVLMLSMVGSLCGFLVFNFHPARVFMGDCGSLFVGFTIASASVACLTKSSTVVAVALPMLAMGVPIFDTLFSILRRFLERRSIFAPDKGHLHHHLIQMGLNQTRAVLIIYAATAIAAGLGLVMMVWRDSTIICLLGCMAMLIVFFRIVGAVRFRQVIDKLRQKYTYASQRRQMERAFGDLQLHFKHAKDPEQWWQAACQAGRSLGLESIDLVWLDRLGNRQIRTWRMRPQPCQSDRLVTICLPISQAEGQYVQCRIVLTPGPSLEWAGQKGALFGRLLDESRPAITSYKPTDYQAQDLLQQVLGLAKPAQQ
jgi:UDP-GlcNAc:undecaprenyl-phosphate GlcNAc-1-phosphate transferase